MTLPYLPPRGQIEPALPDAAWLQEDARPTRDPREQLDYLARFLWRWKRLVFFISAPIMLAGFFYLLIVPEKYSAHATLMVGFRQPELLTAEQVRSPVRGEPDIDGAIDLIRAEPALRHVASELDLAARPELAGAGRVSLLVRFKRALASIFDRTNGASNQSADPTAWVAAHLRKDIKIDRVGRSTLLDLSYTSSDAAMAAKVVNSLAKFSSEDESFLSRMSLAERAGFQIVKVSVVTEAVPPQEPSSPNSPLILAVTTFCALMAGLGALLVKQFQEQRTVRGVEQVTRRGLRALGVILDDQNVERHPGAGVAMVAGDPTHAFSASVMSLHVALSTLPRLHKERGLVLLVTSALPGEGKSTTAAALATSMAASGKRVLLVDGDLRAPTLHRSFGVEQRPGLAEFVDSQVVLEAAIRRDRTTGVHFLASGKGNANPLRVLNSIRFQTGLRVMRAEYDTILIDSPPVLAAGDARILAQLSDYVVVMTRWGSTSWCVLGHALRALQESGARLAGVVVSRVDRRQLSIYDYGGAQIYGAGYGEYLDARGE
ncbi:tyrosine-protein kinase domain-containing protein [Bradyrhizobium monzae]|uniref:tyrosine-protein kinase domain-containing protein n=1 Tax=Bradyrhizobium sp. Oc8 TaxID=2876780 RepID=UPI001F2641B7|nr:tyrosine-protein kinase domain-containing protein [Bradyrhizobium sp. Oc8]